MGVVSWVWVQRTPWCGPGRDPQPSSSLTTFVFSSLQPSCKWIFVCWLLTVCRATDCLWVSTDILYQISLMWNYFILCILQMKGKRVDILGFFPRPLSQEMVELSSVPGICCSEVFVLPAPSTTSLHLLSSSLWNPLFFFFLHDQNFPIFQMLPSQWSVLESL